MSDNEAIEEEKPFVIEKPKTSRASCRNCKEKCSAGDWRLGKLTCNPFAGGTMTLWHHIDCMFKVFLKQNPTTRRIESSNEIEGWEILDQEEQERILDLIKKCSSFHGNVSSIGAKQNGNKKGSNVKQNSNLNEKDKRVSTHKEANKKLNKYQSFKELRKLIANIFNSDSKEEKINCLEKIFSPTVPDPIISDDKIIWYRLLLCSFNKRVLNLSNKQLIKIFSKLFDSDESKMFEHFEKEKDIDETITKFFEDNCRVSPAKKCSLTISDVETFLNQLVECSDNEDKVIEHFKTFAPNCTSNDLHIVVQLMKGNLQLDIDPRHILNTINEDAYELYKTSKDLNYVINKYLKNTGKAKIITNHALMTPVSPIIAESGKSAGEVLKNYPHGMYAELLYGGERVQIHKCGSNFKYFTEQLELFPLNKIADFEEYVNKSFSHDRDLILDCEILLMEINSGNLLPFVTLNNFKISTLRDSTVCLVVFDCMHFNGESLLQQPLSKRKKILKENIKEIKNHVIFSEGYEVHKTDDLTKLKSKILKLNHKGLVLKDMNGTYEPGKCQWFKIEKKHILEGANKIVNKDTNVTISNNDNEKLNFKTDKIKEFQKYEESSDGSSSKKRKKLNKIDSSSQETDVEGTERSSKSESKEKNVVKKRLPYKSRRKATIDSESSTTEEEKTEIEKVNKKLVMRKSNRINTFDDSSSQGETDVERTPRNSRNKFTKEGNQKKNSHKAYKKLVKGKSNTMNNADESSVQEEETGVEEIGTNLENRSTKETENKKELPYKSNRKDSENSTIEEDKTGRDEHLENNSKKNASKRKVTIDSDNYSAVESDEGNISKKTTTSKIYKNKKSDNESNNITLIDSDSVQDGEVEKEDTSECKNVTEEINENISAIDSFPASPVDENSIECLTETFSNTIEELVDTLKETENSNEDEANSAGRIIIDKNHNDKENLETNSSNETNNEEPLNEKTNTDESNLAIPDSEEKSTLIKVKNRDQNIKDTQNNKLDDSIKTSKNVDISHISLSSTDDEKANERHKYSSKNNYCKFKRKRSYSTKEKNINYSLSSSDEDYLDEYSSNKAIKFNKSMSFHKRNQRRTKYSFDNSSTHIGSGQQESLGQCLKNLKELKIRLVDVNASRSQNRELIPKTPKRKISDDSSALSSVEKYDQQTDEGSSNTDSTIENNTRNINDSRAHLQRKRRKIHYTNVM